MTILSEKIPPWYKEAIIYEVHIRSFYDSNGDGIGDFRGLLHKLPYLHDLGITAIWILPFYPSPLRDDGYDIADYHGIHPDYGTLRDFQDFLREAHKLGIRVITELVLNHTSDQHKWFRKSRAAKPGTHWRNFYVWSDTADKFQDARIIFKDFETSNWTRDPVAGAYYWHRFYSHQPDLNYDNPRVHEAMFKVLDFWLGMGVDGLRLDAVPYLYEREGTNCENLPETFQFLKKLRNYVEERYPDRMLLAEANQWPEDAASYFGDGEGCHMVFHFPLMPRMFMALQMEDSFPITNILQQTPVIADACQWALFLRNHDELTLEMVTDEERDYMYRIYASDPRARINLGIRRRLAPLMGNDRRKIELMNVLLFILPGTPIIYYGDEIGMGDNFYLGDRNGVRTPMQWAPDRNAGFSAANPQRLYLPAVIDPEYHYQSINVENQATNSSSLLWWMRRMIDLRKRHKAFGLGTLEFLPQDNPKVLTLLRVHQDESILALVNLSRFAQVVEVNRTRFAGLIPEDIFSRNKFPPIKDTPYVIMLGPYDFHMLLLGKPVDMPLAAYDTPELIVTGQWQAVLQGNFQRRLEQEILPAYLKKCRWFQGKGVVIMQVSIIDILPFEAGEQAVALVIVEVHYISGGIDTYFLPLLFLPSAEAELIKKDFPDASLCRLKVNDISGELIDCTFQEKFQIALFDLFARKKGVHSKSGRLIGRPGKFFSELYAVNKVHFPSLALKAEKSSTIVFGQSFSLKLYRRIQEGAHPETEIGRFLTENVCFKNIVSYAGALEYRRPGIETFTCGILRGPIPSHGDAWSFTIGEITQYLERVLSRQNREKDLPQPAESFFFSSDEPMPPHLRDLTGGLYPEMVSLIGKRTGELHQALSSGKDDPGFTPEPFTLLYQRSLYQSMRSCVRKSFESLKKNLPQLAENAQSEGEELIRRERDILDSMQKITSHKFLAFKTRIHGDFHLGQILHSGDDFFFADFEGDPVRPLSERRLKHSPLRDVASLVYSFYDAAFSTLANSPQVRVEDKSLLEPWAWLWYRYNTGIFLKAYLESNEQTSFVPQLTEDFRILLNAFLFNKAAYELGHQINLNPEKVVLPLRMLLDMLNRR